MAGKLPRGFKAETERSSEELRKELGVTLVDRLDPFVLANHLDVPLHPLSQSTSIGMPLEVIATLLDDRTGFSALTVGHGQRRAVLYNDDHHPNRITSDVVH